MPIITKYEHKKTRIDTNNWKKPHTMDFEYAKTKQNYWAGEFQV